MWFKIKRFVIVSNIFLPLIVALALFFTPMLWFRCHLYWVGGDNSQLYYLMPYAMMHNYLFNIISENSLGTLGVFATQAYQIPFFGLLTLLKCILPNIISMQALCFGMNFTFSFLGFYWLLGLWLDRDNLNERLIKIISSIIYCTSPFIFTMTWRHALYAVYLHSFYPIVIYLLFRSIREQSIHYMVFAALLSMLFSIAVMAIPWLLGAILLTAPLLILQQIKYRWTFRYFIYFMMLSIGLNMFWLGMLVYSFTLADNAYGALNLSEVNKLIIHDVVSQNNIAYPLFGEAMPRWIKDIDKNGTVWSPLLVILPLSVFAAGIFIRRSCQLFTIYLVGGISWIAAIYFYTIRIGSWGQKLFLMANDYLPGFAMFRNNMDKFSIGIAFSFAFLLAMSLGVLVRKSFLIKHILISRFMLIGLFFLIILQAWPLLSGGLWKQPLWTTHNIYTTIHGFNEDFNMLVDYLKTQPDDSKYLWWPLNNAGYVEISDEKLPGHFYVGTSPLRFLANKSDYVGRFSFGSQKVGDQLFQNILDGDYDKVNKLIKTMNIGYVILNNELNYEIINSYLYSVRAPGDLYKAQILLIKPLILGEHVRDFGKRYSLYKIKQQLKLNKFYLDSSTLNKNSVRWRRLSSSKYVVTLNGIKASTKTELVFLEPFGDWSLTTASGKKLDDFMAHHIRKHGYANAWMLSAESLMKFLPKKDYIYESDGSFSITLNLEFAPARWVPYGFFITGITLLMCLIYLIRSSQKFLVNVHSKKTSSYTRVTVADQECTDTL